MIFVKSITPAKFPYMKTNLPEETCKSLIMNDMLGAEDLIALLLIVPRYTCNSLISIKGILSLICWALKPKLFCFYQ